MALIKSFAEVKAALPRLLSTSSNWSNLPDWGRVEEKYIVPVIGRTLYNTLVAALDSDTPPDVDEQALLVRIRRAVIPYGFLDDMGLYVLQLQDSGAKKISQGGSEPVRGWEIQELKNTLVVKATEAMEQLLQYLFDNKDLFPEWTGSAEYTKLKGLLIRTGTDLSEQYTVYQPQRTYFLLKSLMQDMQRMAIQEAIGKDLLEYLRDKGEPTDEEKEAIGYLKKALSFFTVWKACGHFSVQFSDSGFTILGERNNNVMENSMNQPMDLQLLNMKMKSCEEEANSYLNLAKYFLAQLYKKETATDGFKQAFSAGPLADYVNPIDRTTGNETRKIFSF